MAANKESLVRYRAINRCLIEYKIATQDNLIDACTEAIGTYVSWRTIASDIKAMRSNEQLGYFAPIETVKGEGYRYAEKGYSIDSIPLKKEELTAISFAANLLKQYSNIELFSTFSGAVEKLSERVDLHLKQNNTTELGHIISFETSTADGGSKFINEMLQHIRQQTAIEVEYHSFSSNKTSIQVLHPYFLKEYRNRWYVIGFHEKYKELRTLALERINWLKPDYKTTYRPSNFDAESYYQNAIGVSITNQKPQKVVLAVSPQEYLFLKTQPLHHSQKTIEESENEIIIELHVILNYELKSQLLSFGSGIRVIEPPELSGFIKNEAAKLLHK
ncbi:MAG: WYL domain-containing protein [Flavobacteriales bacterium]|nr:WYL domain-containing protein [Flavobacteriales bacterium]